MLRIVLFVIFAAVSVGSVAAQEQSMNLTAAPVQPEFGINETPIIKGELRNSAGTPISGANIAAGFPNGDTRTTTDSDGSFELRPSSLSPGIYSASIIASKNGYVDSTNIKIIINDSEQSAPPDVLDSVAEGTQDVSEGVANLSDTVTEGITKNPASNAILDQIEKFKKQQEMRKEQQEQQESVEQARQLADKRLAKDLNSMEKSDDLQTPEKAFADFVETVDTAVQEIFWGQFQLTQQLHDQGKRAKQEALEKGESSENAMKHFQRKASTSRGQIIDHNEDLNIKYGNATNKTQSQFDEKGKLPRDD